MPTPIFSADPPRHLITEPLLSSFAPKALDNGDIRMAIAKAGQHAYSMWGEEATLTEEFLSRDYKTWEGGLVSINHENNHDWVKATIHDLEYDSTEKLVIATFSGIPEWLKSLIYSPDYRGQSQECMPIEYRKDSMDVIKGYGTGCTIVTDPYEPAANQSMGVGIPPALAAILASKYPLEDKTMSTTPGGGTPAISVEAFESTVSENVQLKSTIKVLESKTVEQEKELASWKQKYVDLESGESKRVEIAIESARKSWETDLKATAEKEAAVTELKAIMNEESATAYLATNPTVEQIKSITTIMRSTSANQVGNPKGSAPEESKKSVSCQFTPDPWTGTLNAEVK